MAERSARYWLWLLLLFLICTRLYGINNPPFEQGDFWRQPDTESVALNFLHYRFNILQPNFNYDGPLPNVVALELQITTPLIAVLYGLFGQHYFLARLVPVLFFTGSCAYLYGFSRRYAGERGALWAVLLYGLFPVNLFFSRSIQPESAGLFFYIGGLYYFQRYRDAAKDDHRWLAPAALFVALAISQKPQTALIGLPMLGLAWAKHGWRMLRQWPLWAFALFALGIPALYYAYSDHVAEFHFVQGIATKHILPEFLTAWRTPAALRFFRTNLPQALTLPGLILLGVSLLLSLRRHLAVVWLWLLGALAYLLTVEAVIRFYYYLVYITPPIAVLMGALCSRFTTRRFAWLPMTAAALIALSAALIAAPLYTVQTAIITQGRIVQQVTRPDDLIIAATFDSALINASNRRGWRYQLHYYPQVPTDPVAELNSYIAHGARYFVTLQGYMYNDPTGTIRHYLDTHYQKLEPQPGYILYKLRPD